MLFVFLKGKVLEMEKQYKVGSNLSAAYMAAVQATDTQQTMKAHDFSEEARAAGLLAATVGYFGLMKSELGQWVLEKSGLEKGREYEVQKSHTNEDGNRVLPDVVINLPDGKKMVIDSKVSLIAYEKYINEEEEEQKNYFLKDHRSLEKE